MRPTSAERIDSKVNKREMERREGRGGGREKGKIISRPAFFQFPNAMRWSENDYPCSVRPCLGRPRVIRMVHMVVYSNKNKFSLNIFQDRHLVHDIRTSIHFSFLQNHTCFRNSFSTVQLNCCEAESVPKPYIYAPLALGKNPNGEEVVTDNGLTW